jgi:hypothetical protein
MLIRYVQQTTQLVQYTCYVAKASQNKNVRKKNYTAKTEVEAKIGTLEEIHRRQQLDPYKINSKIQGAPTIRKGGGPPFSQMQLIISWYNWGKSDTTYA